MCEKGCNKDGNCTCKNTENNSTNNEKLGKNNENPSKKFNFQELTRNFQLKTPDSPQKLREFPKDYKLVLNDAGTGNGYRIRYELDIDIFEFANILAEYFEIYVDIDYTGEEQDEITPVVGYVSSIEDIIASLEQDEEEE